MLRSKWRNPGWLLYLNSRREEPFLLLMSDKFIDYVFANTNASYKIKAIRVNLSDSVLKSKYIFYPFKKSEIIQFGFPNKKKKKLYSLSLCQLSYRE